MPSPSRPARSVPGLAETFGAGAATANRALGYVTLSRRHVRPSGNQGSRRRFPTTGWRRRRQVVSTPPLVASIGWLLAQAAALALCHQWARARHLKLASPASALFLCRPQSPLNPCRTHRDRFRTVVLYTPSSKVCPLSRGGRGEEAEGHLSRLATTLVSRRCATYAHVNVRTCTHFLFPPLPACQEKSLHMDKA